MQRELLGSTRDTWPDADHFAVGFPGVFCLVLDEEAESLGLAGFQPGFDYVIWDLFYVWVVDSLHGAHEF